MVHFLNTSRLKFATVAFTLTILDIDISQKLKVHRFKRRHRSTVILSFLLEVVASFLRMLKLLLSLGVLLLLQVYIVSATPNPVVAQTQYGPIEGFVHTASDGSMANVFLGVPFSKPPVEELRFEVCFSPTDVKNEKSV